MLAIMKVALNFKLAVALLGFLLSAGAFCQEKQTILQLSNAVNNTIVRDYAGHGYVTYVETASDRLFLNVDANMNVVYSVKLPQSYSVKDFRIYNDMVYFCGSNNTAQQGVVGLLGYFYLNEMCTDSNKLYTHDIFWHGPFSLWRVKEFVEMAVFDPYQTPTGQSDTVAIALVGRDINTKNFIMEAIGPANSPQNWRFALGYNSNNQSNEKFNHVVVTRHYVVTGGTAYNELNAGVSLRACDKTALPDMFTNTTIHNSFYRYPTNEVLVPQQNHTMYPIQQQFAMTAMDAKHGDSVATMSLYRKNTSGVQPQTYYGVLVNIYNMYATVTTSNINCAHSLYEPAAYLLAQSKIFDLSFDTINKELRGLYSVNTPLLGLENRCVKIPYLQTLPYTTGYYTMAAIDFNSLTCTDYGTAYLTSGVYNFSQSIAAYYKHFINANPNCSITYPVDYSATEIFTSKEVKDALSIYRGSFGFNVQDVNCSTFNFIVNCTK